MLTRSNENEEVCRRTVRLVSARHRNNAAHVFYESGLVGQMVRHSLRQLRSPLVTRRQIAALNDKTFHDATERRRIERTGRGEIEKIAHCFRSVFRASQCRLRPALCRASRTAHPFSLLM